jgi:hypothetical protein
MCVGKAGAYLSEAPTRSANNKHSEVKHLTDALLWQDLH